MIILKYSICNICFAYMKKKMYLCTNKREKYKEKEKEE